MTTDHRPYLVPDNPIACPFCGNALLEGRFHGCREMRDDIGVPARSLAMKAATDYLPRVGMAVVIGLALLVAMYLGAYVLRSLGVAC